MTLFDMKKTAFENAVRRYSKTRGLDPPPNVSITENPCPLSAGEIAHIHIEERIICIWKKKLEELTLDQIDKVAAHEVAHLFSIEHDGKHAQAQAELEIAGWSSSIGGVVIHGGKKVTPSASRRPKKRGRPKKICHYYSCKKRTKLFRCKYCGELFCKEHLRSKPPKLPPFKQRGVVGRIYMEEWRKTGHACPPYYDYLKAKKKEDLEKRRRVLDKMRGLPTVPPPREIEIKMPPVKRKGLGSIVKGVIAGIAVIILIFILIEVAPYFMRDTQPPPLPPEVVEENGYYVVHYEWQYPRDWLPTTWSYDARIPKETYGFFRNKPRTSDYSEYVDNPADDEWMNHLAGLLENLAGNEGWGEFETVSFALAFVQSWPYTSDDVTTEYDEYPRYPVETIVDGGGDCEDTSILFASIVRGMGYGTVLLHLEEDKHIAVGVLISQRIVDDWNQNYPLTYYTSDGEIYAYCETTGEGWELGHKPEDLKSTSAQLILLT